MRKEETILSHFHKYYKKTTTKKIWRKITITIMKTEH